MSSLPRVNADPVSEYLNTVRAGLKKLGDADREEILAEIRGHLLERAEEFSSRGFSHPAEAAVAAMGDAAEVARQFAETTARQKVSRSIAPWTLLRAVGRIAATGAASFIMFLVGVVGYCCALAFGLVAIAKVLMPTKVGFWIGPHMLVWGMSQTTAGHRELAGEYFIPISLAIAFVFGSGTTLLLRTWMRSRFSVANILKAKKSVG